ncbi:MAG: alpha/beta hydrolase [Cyanobacteria bacterium P01_H01_bin.15]
MNLALSIRPDISSLEESSAITLWQDLQVAPVVIAENKTVQTSFVRQGVGNPALVLLHGFDSSFLEFRRLLPKLSIQQTVWSVDLFGFGFTQRFPQQPVGPPQIQQHLLNFLRSQIDSPVVLVGASMGGAVALDFCLSYPELVQGLVLLDSAGLAKPSTMGNLMFPPLDWLATEILRRPWIRKQIGRTAYFDKDFSTEDAYRIGAFHLTQPYWREALIQFTKSGGYGSLAQQLPQLTLPTLVLWGRNDDILGIQDAVRFAQLLPQSQLIWCERCGHVPHLEQPQFTADMIQRFMVRLTEKP